jgi:hypothetical protein
MKTKNLFLCLIVILLMNFIEANTQDSRHVVGLSYGFQYRITDIWVGDPYNLWIDQTASSIIEGFYYYKLAKQLQAGFFLDFEAGKFDVFGLPEQEAQRLGIGTIFLGHFPDKWIQFQAGGYFGFNTGFINYEGISNRSGIDYGVMVGPAVEFQNFGVAVHHHAGFSWYPKKDAQPDEFAYANTKIKIKLYYTF